MRQLTRAHVTVGLGDSPRSRHKEAEGKVRGGLGQDSGGVTDRDSRAGRGVYIDIVHADGQVADDAKQRGARYHASV